MKGPLIITSVLICAALVCTYWPRLGDVVDRWRDWRDERAFSKRHSEKGR